MLQCVVVCCSVCVLQCSAVYEVLFDDGERQVCCRVLQCAVAYVCCSVLQWYEVLFDDGERQVCCRVLQSFALRCNVCVLQRASACCRVFV